MGVQIHISCPLSVSVDELVKVQDKINDYGHWWSAWDRTNPSTYKDEWIEKAEAVVFMLPGNGWAMSGLPSGQEKEWQATRRLGKKVFLAYRPTYSKDYQIYEAERYGNGIQGKTGSYEVIKSLKSTSLNAASKRYEDTPTWKYDRDSPEVRKDILARLSPVKEAWENIPYVQNADIRLLLRKR